MTILGFLQPSSSLFEMFLDSTLLVLLLLPIFYFFIFRPLVSYIAERKQAEDELREKTETISAIVDTSQEWIWEIDLQGIHTYSNPAVERILGYSPDKLVGKPSFDLMHEEDRQMVATKLPLWISEKRGWESLVIRWRHNNGSWRYLESSAVPIIDANGEIAGFRGVDRDITERKEVESKLKDSEEKYRTLFEKSKDALLIIKNGNFIDCNQATINMLGYNSKVEFINTHPSKLSPKKQPDGKQSLAKADEMIAIAIKNGSHRFEWNHKKANGEVFPVEVLLTSIPTNDKNKIIHTVWRNITERKQAEQLQSVVYQISETANSVKKIDVLYKKIHKILEQVLDVTNFYIAIYDDEENLLSFPFYKDSKDIFPGNARPLGKGLTEYVIRTGKPFILKRKDIEAYAKKGEIDVVGTLPEVWIGAPLITDNKVIGVIALNSYHDPNLYTKSDLKILTFVSEQIAKTIKYKQALTDLQVEKTYLNELFTSSPEALALVSTDSIILDINEHFTSLFGYSKKEVIGKNIDKLLVSPEQKKNAHKYTQEVAAGKYLDLETVRKKKDGTMINVSILGSPVNYKGDILAVYGIYRDITERIKAAEDLIESNSMKELLLDIIAHDLRNPAGVIKGFAQLGLDNDPNSVILDEINKGADNLLNIISATTTLSKVTIGDTIAKEKLNLTNVINIIISENSSNLQNEDMTIDMKLKRELIISANPIISEVFRNYIINAIQYAKNGKKIIIDANIEDGFVVVNVKDFGKTIGNKDRENIFVRNVQLDKTKGQGLGLAIVKRIAIAHDAEVGVKPNKPKGNNFYIKIPN